MENNPPTVPASGPNQGIQITGNISPDGGDFIGRDKVTGDITTVGNISQSTGIAIGPGATATVTVVQEAPKLRLPLQRPPRAEHFVDRKIALDQLLVDLQPGRVVTLCGPGGIGKTALAAEALWQLAPAEEPPDRFPDGILFHSFYNQSQVSLVLEKIALSFGEEPRSNPAAAVQRALAGRRALLLLDGTEQADDLQTILQVHDNCCVLVTSRSHSDALYYWQDISPLPLEEATDLLQVWGKQRAIDKLVAERICALVGYLPLAIRLVGSYLSTRGREASEYAEWLEKTPLAVLEQGKRQQDSVPLLLEHSFAQVSEGARQVMGVVGLLALAPFDQQTIIAALALTSPIEVMRAIDDLTNYSLLLRREYTYEVTHALIHTYARQKLSAPIDGLNRLATYYTIFLNKYKADFTQLDHIRPHILALIQFGLEREAWVAISDLGWAIEDYLNFQGYTTDRVIVSQAGVTAAQALGDSHSTGAWLGNLGLAYYELGQYSQAIEYYQQALSIAQEIGDRRGEGNRFGNLGNVYYELGQYSQAIEYYQQALSIAQEIGDRQGEGGDLGNLGLVYCNLGEYPKAIEYCQQALSIAKEIGNRRSEGNHLGSLGRAYSALGQYFEAFEYYQQALSIAQEIGDRRGESTHLGNLGDTYATLGQVQQAIEHCQQALNIAQEIGHRAGEGQHLGSLGRAYSALGQYSQAIEYCQQALSIAQEIGNRGAEDALLGNLGNVYYALGVYAQANKYYQQALSIAQEIGDRQGEGVTLGSLGNVYNALGEGDQAIEYYQQALSIAQEISNRRDEGTWLANLGTAYVALGQFPKSIGYYQQALSIAQEIGDRRGESTHLGNLGNMYATLGQVQQAIEHCQQALNIAQEIGDRAGEGIYLGSLGLIYRDLGQYSQAIEYCQQALSIAQEIGDRRNEGTWLANLGTAYVALRQYQQAKQYWEKALRIFEEIKSPLAKTARGWLIALDKS